MAEEKHVFGGEWTETKLAILRRYLEAYTTALKKTPFEKIYIDAFAGTGHREDPATARARHRVVDSGQLSLTAESMDDATAFLDGSPRVALKATPPFDRFIFIEKKKRRCTELERLKVDFPAQSASITILNDDANISLQRLTKENWLMPPARRAVLFLDPYGVQVSWSTIEAVARTKAIDLWLLFPLSGVNRMLTNDGQIPDAWRQRLTDLLGTPDWEQALYLPAQEPRPRSLFESLDDPPQAPPVVKQHVDVLARYFQQRLRSVFPFVANRPAILYNSRNSPLFMLCFAASNPKGGPIALRIASHILDMGS